MVAKDVENMLFLSGTGEMRNLIRTKDWSKHVLGKIENWPQSLRTTLGIILNSKFPMFLWWGPELICFYNDAYRPSLGQNGKHPTILGQPAYKAWEEIWNIIKPLIDQVLATGEATWSEDQLIPIYRNGKIEDVYWTFSYSAVNDDAGNPAGILVTCSETTHKVAMLKEIKEREDKLQFTIEAAGLGTWDLNPETNNFKGNARLKHWFGLQEEDEIDFARALDNIIESDRPRVIKAIEAALEPESGGDYNVDYTIVNPNSKQERRVLAKGKALFDENKVAYRFSGTLQDITKQHLVSKKIEESEKRFRNTVKQAPLGITILRGNNFIVEMANEKYLQLVDRKEHDLVGKPLFEALPEVKEVVEPLLKNVMATGKAYRAVDFPVIIKRQNKQEKVYFSFIYHPLKDDDGSASGIIVVASDVTESVKSKQNLQESEQKFRLLADSMPQLIWTSDPEGNMNYFNESVFDYSGLTLNQVMKDGWLQIVHPDERDENIRLWTEAITSGKDFLFEHRFRRYDGEYRWQLSRAIPQKDADGKIRMWVGTSTDIQEQKSFAVNLEKQVAERTAQLEEKNIELEKMNAELQSFAYVASHDLQEPLRKIQTFITLVSDKEQQTLNENVKSYFERIQSAASRMQTLIHDLLLYSRTNSAERVFERTGLPIILEQVKKELHEDIQQKNAVIEDTGLRKTNIIPFQFRQLLHNVIGNSLKFSREGLAPHIQLRDEFINGENVKGVTLQAGKKYYHLTIADNGIGFEEEFSERIFQVFQRLHGRDEYKGTGIGLAIVKKIVENHQGKIIAHGVPGKGATFQIYIPADL